MAAVRDEGIDHVFVQFDPGPTSEIEVGQFDVQDSRSIGGAYRFIGRQINPSSTLHFRSGLESASIPFTECETELFSGLNTAISVRGIEPAEQVQEWLEFLASQHDLQAALIIDTSGPEPDHQFKESLAKKKISGIERVVILTSNEPLGRRDLGDASNPIFAPDTPGKEGLTVPRPAPWVSPFDAGYIYDIARQWFLQGARAVTNIDVSDLLAPDLQSIFDRAVEFQGNYVSLVGQRIFPWRLRKNCYPTFGDHICQRFDGTTGHPRWCHAPAEFQPDIIWRQA
ncbi:MAG: hypothetical protein GKR98_03350 [Boseongicola sp.]|nr:MAG: hypothetical protein GKR98_03350 [Boseongicola sp.]